MGCCGTSGDAAATSSAQLGELAENKRCHFDIRVLRELLEKWLAEHPSGRATRAEFLAAVETFKVNSYVIDRIIDTLDCDGDGAVNFQDAIIALSTFLQGGAKDKIMMVFAVIDRDNNGFVSKQELRQALSIQRNAVGPPNTPVTPIPPVSARQSQLSPQLTSIIDDLFLEADIDHDGNLSFEEFEQVVGHQPVLEQHFAAANAVQRFNDSNTGWSSHYEAVRVLAVASKLINGAQENSEELEDIPGSVVAEVLYSSIGLCPIAVGEFLAHKDPQCPSPEFARCYFARLDFTGMSPDDALRQASQRLCFPREAQQVDRLITAFAWAYSESNPESCMDEDAVSIVSYAILMLNSDAHSDHVRSKMTCSEFVSNTLRAVPGVQQDLLEGIYSRVQKEEIRLGSAVGILSFSSKDNVEASKEVATDSVGVTAVLGQLVNDELGTILQVLVEGRKGRERDDIGSDIVPI